LFFSSPECHEWPAMAVLQLPLGAAGEQACTPSAFAEPCARAVEYSLTNFLFDQACFFAERLVAESPSDDSLYLLASSYLRCGDHGRAYVVLEEKQSKEPRFRYLLAFCCVKLDKLEEAERALLGSSFGVAGALPGSEALGNVPGGAAGLYLLGQVKEQKSGCSDQAIECFSKCLELCPFMWCAFERLSWLLLGAASPAASPGAVSSFARAALEGGSAAFVSAHFSEDKFAHDPILYPTFSADACTIDASAQTAQRPRQGQRTAEDATTGAAVRKRRRNDTSSPVKYSGEEVLTPMQPTSLLGGRTPLADRSVPVAQAQSPVAAVVPPVPARSPLPVVTSLANSALFQTPVELLSRLSPRRLLSYNCSPAQSPQLAGRCASTSSSIASLVGAAFGASDANSRTPREKPTWTPAKDVVQTESDHSRGWTLASLLQTLGEGLHALHRFDCTLSMEALRRLPKRHYNSGFVQQLVGRCSFESADYREAATVYGKCCEDSKLHRALGLEYYSTALWHLKDSTCLGNLARRLLAWDRAQPQAWCVVGNCFSLQRDHEQAIRCFRRAVQLNPMFAYAYTLIAHEYAELEKLDKASEMFKRALSIDGRHYNAWWGLGNLYMRQEEFQNARYHFQRAVDINRGNAVLRISLSQAWVSLNEPTKALELLDIAAKMPNCDGSTSYQKGCVLASMGRNAEAIEQLQRAQNLAPREPCVKYQLGRAYASIGDTQRAFMHFSMATDLCGGRDSKDHQIIVAAQVELQNAMAGESGDPMNEQEDTEAPGTPVSGRRRRPVVS